MEIIYSSPFTPLQQSILMGFILWLWLSIFVYAALWAFDKMYKKEYNDNFYNLGKAKRFFSFYRIKSGKITKHIFWLNIVAHIWILSALCFNIAYAFNQNRVNTFVSGLLTLGLIVFLIIITIFGQNYKSKLEKKKKYGKL